MNKHALRVVMGVFAIALIVGCGGGGGGESASAPEATTAAPESAPVAAAAGGSGSISGLVSFAGDDADTDISMDADPVCSGLHEGSVQTEAIVVSAGGDLANVFVYVKEGVSGSYPAPAESGLLDQIGCTYIPHVSGVQTGQNLVIRNSDPTLHNVHALPTNNPEFNQGQPFQDMEIEKIFENPEVAIRFKCDVHPWMSSWLAVVPHPFFAVSGSDGSFSITGLADGDYVIEAWHETLGAKTQNVTVSGGGDVAVSFDYSS